MEQVILVDEADRQVGFEEKMKAHLDGGKLHRAFSVFIFNSRGEMLLQQRAGGKYHFGGLWTNACCSHPRRGEETEEAAHRRLQQELGFDCELREVFSFVYTATDAGSGLTEREYDHVFVGTFDGVPQPDPEEADAVRWIAGEELKRDMATNPGQYTPWFTASVDRVLAL